MSYKASTLYNIQICTYIKKKNLYVILCTIHLSKINFTKKDNFYRRKEIATQKIKLQGKKEYSVDLKIGLLIIRIY